MKHFTLSVLMLLLFAVNVFAEECVINSASDVLKCAFVNNPEILLAESNKEIAGINRDVTGRWINPNLEAGVGYNMEEVDNYGVELDFALTQTIENPAKKKARVNKSAAEYNTAELLAESQKEMVTMQVLNILNRLRQIEREQKILKKAVAAYESVIKSYEKRPVLSPEDEVSLSLFYSVLNNYRLENNKLFMEINQQINALKTIINYDVVYGNNIFLYPPVKYPEINEIDVTNSIALQQENANVALANAYLQDQKNYNFTDFSIGPYVTTSPNVQSVDTVGVKLTLPIPVYSNKKTTKAGELAVSTAQYKYNAKKVELDNTHKQLKDQYEQGVKLLKTFTLEKSERQLARTENLFKNGRLSSSLLIESHRQLLDNLRLYHQYELETLNSLWQLYAMERKLITNISEVSYEKN